MKSDKLIIIRIKDIMIVTGQSYRTARRTFNAIRKMYNYTSKAFITLKHYCEYTKIEEEVVLRILAV